MTGQGFKKLSHCTYALQYHLVMVTKYRRYCLNKTMLEELRCIAQKQLEMKEGSLLEFNGEEDHVHLLIELPPKVAISLVVNSLKTVTARMMRRDHEAHLKQFYWNPVLWSRSYFIASCGGVPLETIRKYIESQDSP